jgi:hypothetical protein
MQHGSPAAAPHPLTQMPMMEQAFDAHCEDELHALPLGIAPVAQYPLVQARPVLQVEPAQQT